MTTRITALEPPRNGIGVTAGVSTPLGSLNTTYDGGIAITGDLERRLSATFNVAALFGFLRFDQSAGTPLEVIHISASLEAERSVGRMILIAEAGGGRYRFDPGATSWGGHLGAAVQFELTRHVRIGGLYRRHAVSDGGSTVNFGTTQGGLRVVF